MSEQTKYSAKNAMNNFLITYWDLISTVMHPVDATLPHNRLRESKVPTLIGREIPIRIDNKKYLEHFKRQFKVFGPTKILRVEDVESHPWWSTNFELPINEKVSPGLHKILEAGLDPDKRNVETVIPFSGGLDSLLAVLWVVLSLERKPESLTLVHVNYNGPYSNKEEEVARCLFNDLRFFLDQIGKPSRGMKYKQINLPKEYSIDKSKLIDGYLIPGRNGFIASLIAFLYEPDSILLTGHYKDNDVGAADKDIDFFLDLGAIFSRIYDKTISVMSPFVEWVNPGPLSDEEGIAKLSTKTETIKKIFELTPMTSNLTVFRRGLKRLLLATTSCYDPVLVNCGICNACYKRWVAMTANDIYEEYNTPVSHGPDFEKFQNRELEKGR